MGVRQDCMIAIAVGAALICAVYVLLLGGGGGANRRRVRRPRCPPTTTTTDYFDGPAETESDSADYSSFLRVPASEPHHQLESFESEASTAPAVPTLFRLPTTEPAVVALPTPVPVAVPPRATLQEAVDFSDVLVTPEQREEVRIVANTAEQVQTVNERFDAAKRKVTDNRLRPGMHSSKEKRRLMDNLLRRPHCSRRVRSWRTENSDTLRGDVVPKNTSSWGMLRAGRSNPDIDLHPGSMSLLSGLGGRWLSEEIVADNDIDDPL